MKIVNPNDTTHTIKLVPRVYVEAFTFELYNEATQVKTVVNHTFLVVDGILSLTFDFTFNESDFYQIKMFDNNEVIYRGKLLATIQLTQQYKEQNLYYYG